MTGSIWTPELVALLRDCWHVRGLTKKQTQREFAARGWDVTRNAIVGKARRLGLKARPSPLKRPWGSRRKLKTKPKPARPLSVRPCAWPLGDPGESGFHFCDEPAVEGRPYCPDHQMRAHVRAPLKRVTP